MDSDGPSTVSLTVSAPAWRDALGDVKPLAERIVRAALEAATEDVRLRAGEVSLLLTDDAEIRSLNAAYRGKDRSTNVLSFPGLDTKAGRMESAPPSGQPVLLGDVALSSERLLAEAKELRKQPVDHFAHLLVHGTLHLLGYDHEKDVEAAAMEELEASILETLGFAAPYDAIANNDDKPAVMAAAP